MEPTNPETEVASVEDRLAVMFGEKPPAEPAKEAKAEPEDAEQDAAAEEDGEEPPADAVDDDQAEAADETPDTVEIEIDGEVYAVPKKLAPNVLKSKDYTQKTQAVAAKLKEVEERAAFLDQMEQVRGAVFDKATELRGIEAQISKFDKFDWQALADSDTQQYIKLDRAYRELQTQQATIRGEVQQLAEQQQTLTVEQRQQAKARGNEVLARDIKGWGPELGKKLMDNAKASYGFEDAELAEVLDPRMVKVLHDAYKWRTLQAAKPELKKSVAQVKPITVKAARSTTHTQAAQAVSDDRARLKKTGDPKAAEDLLTRLFDKQRKR